MDYTTADGQTYTIKTNNQPRPVAYIWELPPAARAEFDYLDDDASNSFTRYRGQWYDLGDFMRLPNHCTPTGGLVDTLGRLGFQGYASDSYFSGVAVKFSEGGEYVTMATYYC